MRSQTQSVQFSMIRCLKIDAIALCFGQDIAHNRQKTDFAFSLELGEIRRNF